jgi:hypothetical protein
VPAIYPLSLVPPGFRGDYPHMSKHDRALWTRFLEGHAVRFLGFYYDVAMGGADLAGFNLPEPEALGARYNTALKIDAVGITETEAWIIEVRPEATVSALGAALAYSLVAERDRVFEQTIRAAVLCEYMQSDVAWCCAQLGVAVLRA